ncbi:putative NUDIX domain-containing protein [Rosellinia necatrix]|uniref:Putative NUDIX domain-containing protein n=1 Tax=Rosellinia necatrix TaxID=77044 RepID=A0A1S8A759_ROSNE|nr:putative NUDIX domain-containing protein [Rosellinia necatrix]
MYLYMLPLSSASSSSDPVLSAAQDEALVPTPDGGAEITAAHFDDAAAWLAAEGRGAVTLFPPQYFLLHLLSRFLTGARTSSSSSSSSETAAESESESESHHYASQRDRLRAFLDTVPTSTDPRAAVHPTSRIPWARKVISPVVIGLRRGDRRSILALDGPGAELRGSGHGGDWERVVLVAFGKGGPSRCEVRDRQEVLAEERAAKAADENEGAEGSSSKL